MAGNRSWRSTGVNPIHRSMGGKPLLRYVGEVAVFIEVEITGVTES
jgi:hypothetical protein